MVSQDMMGYCNGSKKVNRDKSVLHVYTARDSFQH